MAANFWTSPQAKALVGRQQLRQAHAGDKAAGLSERQISDLHAHFIAYMQQVARSAVVEDAPLLRQRVVGTAAIYWRKFYLRNDFCSPGADPRLLAAACLFLASKTEEAPIHSKVLLHYARRLCLKQGALPPPDLPQLVTAEALLLEQLDGDLLVFSPYPSLAAFLQDSRLTGSEKTCEAAWSILGDSYRSPLHLVHPPHILALGSLCLAAVITQLDLRSWLQGLDADFGKVHEVAAEMLSFYEYNATPISPGAAQRHLDLLGLKPLPMPQAAAPEGPQPPPPQQPPQQQNTVRIEKNPDGGLNAQPRIRPLGSMLATQLNRRHLGPLLWAHIVVSSSSPRLLVDSNTFASPEYEGLGAISAAHDSTESLPPPQPSSAIDRPPILDMRGGGMLWFWSAGVLSYLQQQQDLAAVRLHGSSSGAIAAALAACDVPLELAAQRVTRVLAEHGVHDRLFGLLGVWGTIARRCLDELLPEDAHTRCTGRVRVRLTAWPSLQPIFLERFHSKADVIDACLASGHLPFLLDGRLAARLRGGKAMDGAFCRLRFGAVRLRNAEGLEQLVLSGKEYAKRLHARGVGDDNHPARAADARVAAALAEAAAEKQAFAHAPAAVTACAVDPSMSLPDTQHIIVVDDFLPASLAERLRAVYDERMVLDQLRPQQQRAEWGALEGPPDFRLFRTPASTFFPSALYRELEQALAAYGLELGCCGERGFKGGELVMLQPNVWETDETTVMEPRFNRIILFDGRISYAVRQVEGTQDPLDARISLIGWLRQPELCLKGSLTKAEAAPVVAACQAAIHSALGKPAPAAGTVTVRLEVCGRTGAVNDIKWLLNTLRVADQLGSAPPWLVLERQLGTIAEHCCAARFPPSGDGGDTQVTLPLVFS
ncbi:Cyclin-C1-2 [Chlorella vulgaris]